MQFDVYGPFEIPRKGKVIVLDTNDRNNFWEELKVEGLSDACGCYVFAIRDRDYIPYYVGKSETGFKNEALHSSKVEKYNRVLTVRKRGTPVLFLLPKLTPQYGKFSTQKSDSIPSLEKMLIAMGVRKNPKLLNTHNTQKWRKTVVSGFLNSDNRSGGKASECLRKTFDFG